MNTELKLSQSEIHFLKKIDIEISLNFLHLLNLDKSIPLKDIREIKIKSLTKSKDKKILHFLKYLIVGYNNTIGSKGFNGSRPDREREIVISLFNNKAIKYEVKNIDSITTSKIFKKIFDSIKLNSTSIN